MSEELSFREKVRTIAAPRSRTWHKSERKAVADDRDGKVAGHHDVHWDGAQDATINPRTITAHITTEEG